MIRRGIVRKNQNDPPSYLLQVIASITQFIFPYECQSICLRYLSRAVSKNMLTLSLSETPLLKDFL